MMSCCINMTPVTFRGVSNCTVHVPLTGMRRNGATDGGVDYRDPEQGLTEMAHELLVADKEYVVIGGGVGRAASGLSG